MMLAEAHAILEQGQQGEVVLQGLGDGHHWLACTAVGVDPAKMEALPQALNEVVLGQSHPLVCPHTVVTEVFLAVKAMGRGLVLLITGAALRVSHMVWL